ncbi:transposase [Mesorhizobium sp. B2-4-15]|nr:transposase [Mesorhizobium sp. B2-4-15]TPM14133.1 transposase [Mesorhizobium sp. B2-3-5]
MRACFGSTMSSGLPLAGLPKDYGPHKTVYNRFARWREGRLAKYIQKRCLA